MMVTKPCKCGCGRTWQAPPKDRRKFFDEKCCKKYHNGQARAERVEKRPKEEPHRHPCNSGVSPGCLAKKSKDGMWLAPNKFLRTCPECRHSLRVVRQTYTEEGVLYGV